MNKNERNEYIAAICTMVLLAVISIVLIVTLIFNIN